MKSHQTPDYTNLPIKNAKKSLILTSRDSQLYKTNIQLPLHNSIKYGAINNKY